MLYWRFELGGVVVDWLRFGGIVHRSVLIVRLVDVSGISLLDKGPRNTPTSKIVYRTSMNRKGMIFLESLVILRLEKQLSSGLGFEFRHGILRIKRFIFFLVINLAYKFYFFFKENHFPVLNVFWDIFLIFFDG